MVTSGAPAWEQRWHPLREEWVVVAAHRQDRPWQGERATVSPHAGARVRRELLFLPAQRARRAARGTPTTSRCSSSTTTIPASAPMRRARSSRRPASTGTRRPPASRASSATRRSTTRRSRSCRSPRSPTCCAPGATSTSSSARRPDVRHVLTFENKGEVVGVSNPHPHGQIYATNFVFKTIETEAAVSRRYYRRARPRALPGHHPRRAGRRTPDSVRELVGDRLSSVLRALRLRVLRRAEGDARQPGDDVGGRAATSWRSRSSRCWSATTTCGRCRSRTC